MEIGTLLFAITATCSYAMQLNKKFEDDETPLQLAELFSLESQRKIDHLFDKIANNNTTKSNKLAKSILKGDMKWLEDGIIQVAPE